MNKLLLTFMAASLSLSAVAADLEARQFNLNRPLIQKETLKKELPQQRMTRQDIQVPEFAKTRASAAALENLEGTWRFSMGDYYFEDSPGSVEISYVASADIDSQQIVFQDPTQYELPFFGVYDETETTINFPIGYLGYTTDRTTGSTIYIYQHPFIYVEGQGISFQQSIQGKFNSFAQTLTFVQDTGIAWLAYPTQNPSSTSEKLGYFAIYDLEGATMVGGAGDVEEDEEWTNFGNATFMDGWILPGFGVDQMDPAYQYQVAVEQNLANPNIYRLVNPYQSGPAAQANQSKTGGYIVFDITDPDHVVFNTANAGFANSSAGISSLYCYNMLGSILADAKSQGAELTVDAVIEYLGDEVPYTTCKEGVIYLGSITTDEGIQYDANFGIQGATTGGYVWKEQDGSQADMTASITIPLLAGVESLGVDENENAPVIYYNLQGQKVENPENGIFIKKQGSKTEKVVIR